MSSVWLANYLLYQWKWGVVSNGHAIDLSVVLYQPEFSIFLHEEERQSVGDLLGLMHPVFRFLLRNSWRTFFSSDKRGITCVLFQG